MLIFTAVVVLTELLAAFYYGGILPVKPQTGKTTAHKMRQYVYNCVIPSHAYTYAVPDFLIPTITARA